MKPEIDHFKTPSQHGTDAEEPWVGGSVRVSVVTRGLLLVIAGAVASRFLVQSGREPRKESSESIVDQRRCQVIAMAFAPHGRELATIYSDETVRLWDTSTRRLRACLRSRLPSALAYSPDGATLGIANLETSVTLLDVPSGKARAELVTTSWSKSISFSPDGRMLAVGQGDGVVTVWDPTTCRLIATLHGHAPTVGGIAFSRDGRVVAVGDFEGRILFWEVESGRVLRTIKAHEHLIANLAYSPDGRILASTGWHDPNARLWDATDGKALAALNTHGPTHGPAVSSLTFSPDGTTLGTAGGNGTLKLWEIATGKERPSPQVEVRWIFALRISPDGKTLAVGGTDEELSLYALTPPHQRRPLSHRGRLPAIDDPPGPLRQASLNPGIFR